MIQFNRIRIRMWLCRSCRYNTHHLFSILTICILFIVLCPGLAAAQGVDSVVPTLLQNSTDINVQGNSSNATPIPVCVSQIAPLSECSPNSPPSSYTGFSIEVFRVAAKEMNLTEGTDYEFVCQDFDQTIASLINANQSCPVAVSAITITSERQKLGIMFSYPYWSAALGIMVSTTVSTSSGWGFFSPFSAELWGIILATIIVFPLCLYIIEIGTLKRRFKMSQVPRGLHNATVSSTWALLGLETIEVASWGSKTASLTFAFMALILINNYTANLAASLTIKSIKSQITSVADLRGKSVLTSPIYIDRLRSEYGIVAAPQLFEGYETMVEISVPEKKIFFCV